MTYVKRENFEHNIDPQHIPRSNMHENISGEYVQSSGQPSITAFLAKLWALVNDPTCDDLIAWDSSGTSFHVYDQARFAREILPRYFKHNNFASFIRQLNMYGFRKMSTIEHGSLQNERDDIEFGHPHFLRGQESQLELIKRRAPETQHRSGLNSSSLISTQDFDIKSGRFGELSQLLEDVRNLQSKQTSLSDKLSYMQTENQALWGEIGVLRQKHAKQQQIVSKLMQFLLNFIASNTQHAHDPSVTKETKGTLTNDLSPMHLPTNTPPLVLSDETMSPNSLKRKQAALMHGDEPNKRPANQHHPQQQQQQPAPSFGRQQSVTINELSDHDSQAWAHATTATTPLVYLVPSPQPAPAQHEVDQHHSHSQQAKVSTNIGNGDHQNQAFEPDFVLRTNDLVAPPTQPAPPIDSTGIKTSRSSPTKQVTIPATAAVPNEQKETLNTHTQADALIDPTKAAPILASSIFSPNQEAPKLDQTNQPVTFSLDDIVGDVDHIQTSLDNIRDFMFESLPDGTSYEDLFGEESEFLSPLLAAADVPSMNINSLTNNLSEQKQEAMNNHPVDPLSQQIHLPPSTTSDIATPSHVHPPISNVNNQLLQQLIYEKATVQEQRQHIDQLEREQSNLKDKIQFLEQQAHEKHQQ